MSVVTDSLTLGEGRDFFFLNLTCKMGVVLWDRDGSVSLNLVEVVEILQSRASRCPADNTCLLKGPISLLGKTRTLI